MSDTPYWWLLDLEIEGRVYRFSHDRLSITETLAGGSTVVREYGPGLASALAFVRGDEGLSFELLAPDVDWVALSAAMDGSPATLRRWRQGTDLVEAVGFASGIVVGFTHGRRDEPVAFTVARPLGAVEQLGQRLPDELAKVSSATAPAFFPAGLSVGVRVGNNKGDYYPIVFGAPGRVAEDTAIPVMPAPILQWLPPTDDPVTDKTVVAVVAEGTWPGDSSLTVAVDTLEAPWGRPYGREREIDLGIDRAGRLFTAMKINGGWQHPPSADERWTQLVGFSTFHIEPRDAYSVIEYMLRRWGRETVDWARLPEVRDDLEPYLVDTWIDDTVDDPWSWIEDVLLPDLPYEIRTSDRGRYLVRLRYTPTGDRVLLSRTEGVDAIRVAGRTRSLEGPYNELSARYRLSYEGAWLGRLIMTGQAGITSAPEGVSEPEPDTEELVTVVRDTRCSRSFARWGLREAEPREVDWTWDTGTVQRVLTWVAARDAVPAWVSSYWIKGGGDLEPGDEVEITDEDFGLEAVPMLVDGPVTADRTDWALVPLRYEAE